MLGSGQPGRPEAPSARPPPALPNVPVQRWLRLTGSNLLDKSNLDEDHLNRVFVKWLGRKNIPEETRKKILALATEWIVSDQDFSKAGKPWGGYAALFDGARAQLGSVPPPSSESEACEMPDAAPMSPVSDPFEEAELPALARGLVPKLRRAGSLVGSTGPPSKTKFADLFGTRGKPFYKQAFERHRRDKEGTLSQAAEHASFAGLLFELQGGSSQRLTQRGGGPAPPYSKLFSNLAGALPLIKDPAIGALLVGIMARGEMPGESLPIGVWQTLAEIFAVVVLPEMGRAVFAPVCFLAAANWVALGKLGLAAAFSGSGAVYLGAEKGGAAALRGTISGLPSKKAQLMTAQQQRAEVALAALLGGYVSKMADEAAFQDRMADLQARILLNVGRFQATAQKILTSPRSGPSSGDPSSSPSPGAPPASPVVLPSWLSALASTGRRMTKSGSTAPTSLQEALTLHAITAVSASDVGNLCAIDALRRQLALAGVALGRTNDQIREEAGFTAGAMIDLVAQGRTLATVLEGRIGGGRRLRIDVVVWTGTELVLVENVVAAAGSPVVHCRLVLDETGAHFHSVTGGL